MHELVSLRGYLCLSLAGLGIGMAAARPAPVATSLPIVAPALPGELATESPIARHEEAPPADEIMLAFTADGTTYLALEDLDAHALPAHGKFQLRTEDTTTAIAPLVRPPPARSPWLDRSVIVDGTCQAKIVGFAIVARLTGDPDYAGVAGEDPKWDVRSTLAHGHVMLAAKLDRCTGRFARAASAPPIRPFVPKENATAQVQAARQRLIDSDAGLAAATEWGSSQSPGKWFEQTEFSTQTVRDPRSGTQWLSMHAHSDFACGGPNVNVWGLFRIERDGSLTTIALRELDQLSGIDQLVDTNNDGIPELVGHGFLTIDTAIVTATGDSLLQLETPFYGCPC